MDRIMTGYHFGARAMKKQEAFTKLDSIKKKFIIKLFMLVVFSVGLALFYTWSRIQIVQMGYQINEYKLEQQILVDQNKRLKVELSFIKSPQHLRQAVADQLKMTLPTPDRVIEVK